MVFNAQLLNLLICGSLLVGAAFFVSPRFASSIAMGIALESFNLRNLRRSAHFFIHGAAAQGAAWIPSAALRFGLSILVVAVTISYGASPMGLVLGVISLFPALIYDSWKQLKALPVQVNQPATDEEWELWNPWLANETIQRDDEQDEA